MRRSGTGRAEGGGCGGGDDAAGTDGLAVDASAASSQRRKQPLDKALASLSMRVPTATGEPWSQQSPPALSSSALPQNPLEAITSALASLVASFAPQHDEDSTQKLSTPHHQESDWRANACFPARLVAPASASSPASSSSAAAGAPSAAKPLFFSSPSSTVHDLATTGSRVFPLLGRVISIYDFGVYVDAVALQNSSSAAALRATAPGALRAAAAVSSSAGAGDNGEKRKKRRILRFVPILPGLLDRRKARRRQPNQSKQQQQEVNESRNQQQQQARTQAQAPTARQQHPTRPTLGEQLPLTEEHEDDPALPFGAALRSADDVPMSLVVRSRRALPIAILRAEYERILSRRIQRLGGSPDDRGLREMLSHFRADALPPSARHSGGILNGLGGLAGLAGFGGIKGFDCEKGKSRNAGALAKGAVIEFHRSPGGRLTASVDGAHVATVDNSVLLAAAVFDLYIGAQPVCGAARASAHEAVAAWVTAAAGSQDGGRKKGGGGEGEEEPGLARRLLAGGPRARATSGAAVCDDDEEREGGEGGSCERGGGKQQLKEQQPRKRWGLLLGGGGGSGSGGGSGGGGFKEILG